MEDGELAKRQYEMLAEFRYALRRFLSFSEHQARDAGLTPQQHQAMLAVAGAPGKQQCNIGELAERLQLEPHSAVGVVNRLSADGLFERVKDGSDHRKVQVRLTEAGWATLARLSSAHRREIERLAPDLIDLLAALVTQAE